MPEKISVLVPARRAVKFLRPCLASIYAQQPNGFEVVVGVDGCRMTLEALRGLRATQFPALRILWGEANRGAYVTRNTLASRAAGDYIVFFDADDTMLSGLIAWIETRREAREISQFRFVQRFALSGMTGISKNGARGVFGIRRDSFDRLGGFYEWPCSADTEFQRRAARVLGAPALSPQPLFVYRRHPLSLTRSHKTGARSALRRSYQQKIAALSAEDLTARLDAPIAEMKEV